VNTRPSLWCGVVTGGRSVADNLVGVATRREQRREDLGEEGAGRRAPSVSDGGAVTGWQTGTHAEMGRGQCRAGLAVEKASHDDFSN
jgi:hypothetical protein